LFNFHIDIVYIDSLNRRSEARFARCRSRKLHGVLPSRLQLNLNLRRIHPSHRQIPARTRHAQNSLPRRRGQPVCAAEAGILAVTILQQKQQLFSMKKIPPGNNQDSD